MLRRVLHLRTQALLLTVALAGCATGGGARITTDAGGAMSARPPVVVGADPAATAATQAQAQPQHYRVRPGESLSQIADRLGVGPSVLAQANGIAKPYKVHAGQFLIVPPREQPAAPRVTTVASNGTVETLRRGETLSALAARHGLGLGDILAANPGLKPAKARPGQKIRIPGDVVMPAAPPMSPDEVALVQGASKAKPPSLSGDGFVWPVRGKVVNGFGDKPDGTRNDGLNIAAPVGTPIVASENGIVVYADDKLPGYGNMLLIRHAGNFTTAYAHAQTLLVKVGDRVKRGQRIATVGTTGGLRTPQLHFELRTGRDAIDPQRYLEGDPNHTQVASRGG
jgi:murein DD-endopeptidase MepM/ murein hydrolase activator NlpD